MKRTITGVAIVATFTMAGVSTIHAWSVAPSFRKSSSTSQRSGRDSLSQGKNSAGRDRYEVKNSFNRTNSPDVRGNADRANFGTMFIGGGQIAAGGNNFGGSGKKGHSNLTQFGYQNSGVIGSGGNSATGGSLNLGDTHIIGDSAIKATSGQ